MAWSAPNSFAQCKQFLQENKMKGIKAKHILLLLLIQGGHKVWKLLDIWGTVIDIVMRFGWIFLKSKWEFFFGGGQPAQPPRGQGVGGNSEISNGNPPLVINHSKGHKKRKFLAQTGSHYVEPFQNGGKWVFRWFTDGLARDSVSVGSLDRKKTKMASVLENIRNFPKWRETGISVVYRWIRTKLGICGFFGSKKPKWHWFMMRSTTLKNGDF